MFDERRKPSIGELYSKITVSSEDFSAGERRLEKMPDHPFVALCKKLYALSPSLGKKGSFNEDNRQAVAFLKWKLSAQEFTAACAISLILFVAAAFLLGTIVLYFPLADVLDVPTDQSLTRSLVVLQRISPLDDLAAVLQGMVAGT